MKTAFVAIIAITLAIQSLAQPPSSQGRVSINGYQDGIALSPGKAIGENGAIMNANWDKDPIKGKQCITAFFPANTDWKRALVTFTPDKDGTISIQLMGAWNKDGKQDWTFFDDIQIEGTELKNGSFEEGIANWNLFAKDGKKATISNISKSGEKSLKVSHDFSAVQNVYVKAAKPVTIAFWFKAAE